MIRLALWIVSSLVISLLAAWLISLPGTLILEVGAYRMQPRLGVAIVILLVLAGIAVILWSIVSRLLAAPRLLARRAKRRRREQGFDALSDGFIALSAGDPARARMLAREARTRLPSNAAAQLLEARADLALGDMGAARENYRVLIGNERTALAALAGLYEQARAQGRDGAALTFARKAASLSPATPWASAAVFDDLTRAGAWSEALEMVNAEPAVSREEKARKRRRQAVLQTALAQGAQTRAPLEAFDHANAALKLLPDFVPAALIAARIHINRSETRKAMSLLRRVWRTSGHPDAATLYTQAQSGASAVERLKRARELIDTAPNSQPAGLVLARAAIDAYEWSIARNALARFSVNAPTQAVCLLMAEIEEGQNADAGKAREWLARAVRAPRDPAWVADGIVSTEWEPTSPVTGKLDAFEWKVPTSSLVRQIGLDAQQRLEAPEAPSLPAPT